MRKRSGSDIAGFIPMILVWCLVCLSLTLAGCRSGNKEGESVSEENVLTYARMLRMYDGEGFSVAEVLNPTDTSKVLTRYVMVPRDSVLPDNLPDGVILRIPLQRLTVFSTIYTDALDELGASSSIAGVVDATYINTPSVLKGIEEGRIVDCGSSMSPTTESILSTRGDGIIYCQYEGMDISGIDRTGLTLITMVDNYETSPLGRAEWILFLGQLTGRRAEAERQFEEVSTNYLKIKEETTRRKKRLKVMTDNLYQGVWYVPGGRSYQARLISDAGGDYILSGDESTGSLNLSLEEMLSRSKDAEVWIMRSVVPISTRSELLQTDNRYKFFAPFEMGNVYVADGTKTDIFTLSAFHPDRVLEEYSAVFDEVIAGPEGSGPKPLYYHRLK